MANPFIAEIRIFPFNFPPSGWAFCDGQLLPISQNTALFSLLGTTYGGNGQTNFALPNLQGSVPVQQDQGPGLSLYNLGQKGGSDTVTLSAAQMPGHSHFLESDAGAVANQSAPSLASAFASSTGGGLYQAHFNVVMSSHTIGAAGGKQPHNNLMPHLTLSFCIALLGIFPARN
jgi:microcystin-dependent protein